MHNHLSSLKMFSLPQRHFKAYKVGTSSWPRVGFPRFHRQRQVSVYDSDLKTVMWAWGWRVYLSLRPHFPQRVLEWKEFSHLNPGEECGGSKDDHISNAYLEVSKRRTTAKDPEFPLKCWKRKTKLKNWQNTTLRLNYKYQVILLVYSNQDTVPLYTSLNPFTKTELNA